MSKLHGIVAMGNNFEMGLNGKLPWCLPADLKYFRTKTLNSIIIMGRKTFESFPNGPLDNRFHIVLTRDKEYALKYLNVINVAVFNEISDILRYLKDIKRDSYVIGGAEIFTLFSPYIEKIYCTKIEESFEADVFFPVHNFKGFKVTHSNRGFVDDKNKHNHRFEVYEKVR